MRDIILTISAAVALSVAGSPAQVDYMKIHRDALVIDAHNDLAGRLMAGEDLSVRTDRGHSDLPRFLEGGVDAEVLSIFVSPGEPVGEYFSVASRQIDAVDSFTGKSGGRAALAKSAGEIVKFSSEGKFVVLLGVEGGHAMQDDLRNLDYFYRRGVRYMTLTWNNSTSWATSARDEANPNFKRRGLSPFGKKVVREMNRLGMMVDVSHLGEKSFWDVIGTAKKPVIASHSSVWKICPNRRNLKDDQILAIAKTGGGVFINFAPSFLDSTFDRRVKMHESRKKDLADSLKALGENYSEEKLLMLAGGEALLAKPSVSELADHIDYVAKLSGVDHVGLGSDFDGISRTPAGMDDVRSFPSITGELVRRGYTEKEIGKILGGNFIRILRENEK